MNDEQRRHLEELLQSHQKRLYVLEKQAAQKGWNTSPEVQNEINELKGEISKIEAKIRRDVPQMLIRSNRPTAWLIVGIAVILVVAVAFWTRARSTPPNPSLTPQSTAIIASLQTTNPPATIPPATAVTREATSSNATSTVGSTLLPTITPTAPAAKNIAPSGKIEVSSVSAQGGPKCQLGEKAIDGVISGYPQNPCSEWASDGELNGAWLRITFSSAYQINKVVLYDRPNPDDHIIAGALHFSDGTTAKVPELPNDGSAQVISLDTPKNVKWVEFTVDRAEGAVTGLSEIEVFGWQ